MRVNRILLTGGTGMVGRNILESDIAANYEILAPTRHELDLANRGFVYSFMMEHEPDLVIHAAGKVGGIKANLGNNLSYYRENLEIGHNVLLCAAEAGIKNLLNLGSSCMYPTDFARPIKEADLLTGRLEPTNEGYALAKVAIAKLAEYIAHSDTEFNYRTIIPCNLYGRYDKFDLNLAHMIPAVIMRMHEAKITDSDIQMWGDGSARREFMHISDLIDFLRFAIPNLERLPCYLNVGIGSDYSIETYYLTIAKVIGFEGAIIPDLEQPTGMQKKQVDVSALSDFGWESVVDLEKGIRLTYEYYKELISDRI
jgi:GDP-L-fucose synthase